jgi:hypothetical protein
MIVAVQHKTLTVTMKILWMRMEMIFHSYEKHLLFDIVFQEFFNTIKAWNLFVKRNSYVQCISKVNQDVYFVKKLFLQPRKFSQLCPPIQNCHCSQKEETSLSSKQ